MSWVRPRAVIALAVGLFNLFIIIGNAAGGSLLDRRGPAVHTVVALGATAASCAAYQLVGAQVPTVLGMSAGFGFATGLGFTFLSSYPAYLTSDTDGLKRVNALLSVVSNVAVVAGPAIGGLIAAVLPAQRVFVFSGVLAVLAVAPTVLLLRRVGCEPAAERHGAAARSAGEREATGDAGTFADSVRAGVLPSRHSLCCFWSACWLMPAMGPSTRSSRSTTAMCCALTFPGWAGSRVRRGVGSVRGAVLAMRVPHRSVNVRTLMLLIAAEGAACMLYVGTPFVGCAIGRPGALLGAAFGMVTPLQNTLVQMYAPLRLLGRVNSVMNVGFNGAGVIPLFAAPVLASMFGVQGVLVGASCVVFGHSAGGAHRASGPDRAPHPRRKFA